jgi:hemoglobin
MPAALLRSTLAATLLLATAVSGPAAQPQATPPADEEPQQKTLFDRLGGTYVLAAVVDDFVEGLYADPVVNARAAVKQALKRARKAGVKFQTTSLLCQETGGPCKYDGRALRQAHSELGLTAREWDAAAAGFKRALARAKVPAAERQELMNLLGTTKGDIVIAPAAK